MVNRPLLRLVAVNDDPKTSELNMLVSACTTQAEHPESPSSDAATLMSVEKSRLEEVIAYALQLEASRSGDSIGATKRLAQRLGCSPTMMTRYKRGVAEPNDMRLSSIVALAQVCSLDPGSLIRWFYDGREAAWDQEHRLTQQLPELPPLDLVNRLKDLLETEAQALKTATKVLDTARLSIALGNARKENTLVDRLAEALGCRSLLELCADGRMKGLNANQEESMATLLDLSKEEFTNTFYVAADAAIEPEPEAALVS